MTSDRRLPVAIIGGGFSGSMVAAQLARQGIKCVLLEGADRAGLGVAYSTREPAHVLNVRAESMSAWADDPSHFANAFEREGGSAAGFAERRMFGRYVSSILAEAVATGLVNVVNTSAIAARPCSHGWTITLDGLEAINASALVLAIGNQPPEPLPFGAASPRFINNPWSPEAHAAVEHAAAAADDVLVVGTGLTMIDTVLSLDAAGHAGRIVALSRRGLIPKAHAAFAPAPVDIAEVPGGNVRSLWRWLRRRSAELGWRAAVDSLRPHSHALWQALPPSEQRRFLRHARPWWDVHRHRIAPEVAERIHGLVAGGRLEVVAGRLAGMSALPDGLEVQLMRRGGGGRTLRVGYAFNCTGPLGRIDRTGDPLLKQMLEDGLVRPDHLGMGLEVDERSRTSGVEPAWAMGPLTKGRYWEIVAVPDIRGQAAAVAEDIATELGR